MIRKTLLLLTLWIPSVPSLPCITITPLFLLFSGIHLFNGIWDVSCCSGFCVSRVWNNALIRSSVWVREQFALSAKFKKI